MLSATPQLPVDEVEQVQGQRIAGLIGHIFQLTYPNMVDELIQQEKLNRRCHSCAIQHPSQRQHSCLMMDKKDSRLHYREDVVEKIDLNPFFKGKALGARFWTSMFLSSLELDGFDGDLQSRILRATHDGPNGLKSKDFSDQQAEIEYPEQVVKKDEQPMEIDSVINDIHTKLRL